MDRLERRRSRRPLDAHPPRLVNDLAFDVIHRRSPFAHAAIVGEGRATQLLLAEVVSKIAIIRILGSVGDMIRSKSQGPKTQFAKMPQA